MEDWNIELMCFPFCLSTVAKNTLDTILTYTELHIFRLTGFSSAIWNWTWIQMWKQFNVATLRNPQILQSQLLS